jgi:hypothetical protein
MTEPYHTEAYKLWEDKKLPPSTILDHIRTIKRPSYQALAAFLYLTGCRIQEVIPYKGHQDWKDRSGIRKQQVIIDVMMPNKVKVTGVRNLKRRVYRSRKVYETDPNGYLTSKYHFEKDITRRNKSSDLIREVGFSIGKDEQPFWNIFLEHYNTLTPDQELFPFYPQQCYYALCMRKWKNSKGEVVVKEGGMINH